MRSKYLCKNCGAKIKKDAVDGYLKNGFALWHINCQSCGETTIRQNGQHEKENLKNEKTNEPV